ncbi:MAG TPA: tRNA(Met) cytidine acetyltransferase, partial [Methylophaga aminisulfidivorans]|nr:tRNA(Met) cytidine acetyltransferase [Methylophaga aminisulfidivorans]
MIPQRQCIFLQGDTEWCHSSLNTLLADFEQQNTLYLSQHITPDSGYKTIPQKQAQQQLGKEFDAVVFDATEEFSPDSFGAIVGTVKAGGALIVLLSSTASESLWLKRFRDIANEFCTEYDCFFSIEQGDELPTLMALQKKPSSQEVLATADQSTAIEAILKVVSGHRRRPLVLSSDRGRGKSAVLGMAAAELIKQGKQSIIVTAPSLATVASLFEYAGRLLPEAKVSNSDIELDGAQIRFIAPDALLESDIKADLVLVDEAAAIPAAMLEQLLKKFSRIAFASTIHGYEGTGLGFAIRFKHTLDDTTPNWRSVKMTQPIRWAENDALEAFSFKALLLDAEPARDELLAAANVDNVAIEVITAQQLLADERLLAEVFGLMVMAHYRTRPSDLQMMLDRDDMTIVVMRYQHHVVASAWCIAEPALSPALAQQVYDGERRLKGQLCPQSLLVHAGLLDAGRYHY